MALGQCAHENLAGLLGGRLPPALLVGVHALVRPLQSFGGGRGFGRHEHAAVCSGDREAGAVVCQRASGALDDGLRVRILRAQDAELVAAHPVGRATAGDEAAELLAEASEQGISGGMAEGIVVVLEAVEVEHGEDMRRLLLEDGCQVVEQLPAVPETREGIGASLVAGAGEHLHVLRERHREAYEDGQDGGRREDEREGVDGPEVVVHEHGERQEAAADRRDEHRPALEAGANRPPGWLPRRPGEQHAAADPAQVGCAAGNVRAGCRLEQVQTVADREDEQTGGDQCPRSADSPAGDREHPDHERDRRQVGERIGEIGRDRRLRAAGGVEHRLEHDRGTDRRHGQAGDDAVEPDAASDGARTRAQQAAAARRRSAGRPPARTRRRGTGRAATAGRHRQTSRSCSRRPRRRPPPRSTPRRRAHARPRARAPCTQPRLRARVRCRASRRRNAAPTS